MEYEKFKLFLVAVLVLITVFYFVLIYYYKKKGKNILDTNFQLKIEFLFVTIIATVFWLSNLGLEGKIIITFIGLGIWLIDLFFSKVMSNKDKQGSKCSLKNNNKNK